MTLGPWLVTGASGFLGRHLLQSITSDASNPPIIALVRDVAAWQAMPWTHELLTTTTLTGGLDDSARWSSDPALSGMRGIFHCAALVKHDARDAAEVARVNVDGTLAMVRVAAEHRCRMILLSTTGTVGCFRRQGASADETAPFCETEVARWPYYRSKVRAEREARALAADLGGDLVIARPPVLVGPGDHRYRSIGHLLRYLEGRLPFLIQGGMHFADVRDVAHALVRMMTLPDARPVYHLPGTVCTVREFYEMVAAASGGRPPRIVLPGWMARLLSGVGTRLGLRVPSPALVDMASHFWSVHSLYAKDELGYQSRNPGNTVRDAVSWLREQGAISSPATGDLPA